jgi:uncharacterized protein YecE (DUF72 family)
MAHDAALKRINVCQRIALEITCNPRPRQFRKMPVGSQTGVAGQKIEAEVICDLNPKCWRGWREVTPDDFIFAWKASRFITHWKRLSENSRSSLALMETRLRLLGDKVGPILFQLPARFTANRDRLAQFIKLLKTKRRYAFEFRHSSWFEPAIIDLLRDNDISLCISDHHDAPAPWEITASFVYVRAHGPRGTYAGCYSKKRLCDWAARIAKWNCDVYVYIDNDQKSAAPKDAQRLKEIVDQ